MHGNGILSYLCRTTATGGTTIDMANNKITSLYRRGGTGAIPAEEGYGVVLLSPPYRKELSRGFRLTTNNRMELLASSSKDWRPSNSTAAKSPSFPIPCYVVDAVTKGWVFGWEKRL